MNQRIICAGMIRSGSTWLYNAVRLLTISNGDDVYATWIKKYKNDNSRSIHIVKAHLFVENLLTNNAIVLTTYRDLRDIVASMINKGWITIEQSNNLLKVQEILDETTTHHRLYKEKSKINLKYEDIIKDKALAIKKIAITLDIKTNNYQSLADQIEGLAYTKQGYDQTTLLHNNHRTTKDKIGYYKNILSLDTIRFIEEKYKDWLTQYEYQ